MRSLVVAVAQPPVHPLDVAANATRHAAAVRASAARLVVFPELSLTGYDMDAPLLSPDDPRLRPLIDACAATDTIAVAGAPVAGATSAAGPHIAMLLIDGAGARVAYRKLYPHGVMEARFRPGPAPEVIEVDGWRIGLGICRDTGVAEHAEATAALGIDAYVAGVVEAPDDAETLAGRARRVATTYGVWTAIASAAGHSGPSYPATAGHSGIWAPNGTVAARTGRAVGEIARATLTAERLVRV